MADDKTSARTRSLSALRFRYRRSRPARLLIGTSISFRRCHVLAPFPIDMLGLNCATGSRRNGAFTSTTLARNLARCSDACMPNAGLPETRVDGARSRYPLEPDTVRRRFAALASEHRPERLSAVAAAPCRTISGKLRKAVKRLENPRRRQKRPQQVSSVFSAVDPTQEPAPLYIGERANATGSKKFRDALLANDYDKRLLDPDRAGRNGRACSRSELRLCRPRRIQRCRRLVPRMPASAASRS